MLCEKLSTFSKNLFYSGILPTIEILENRKPFVCEDGRILPMLLGVSNFILSTENKHVAGRRAQGVYVKCQHFIGVKAPELFMFHSWEPLFDEITLPNETESHTCSIQQVARGETMKPHCNYFHIFKCS